MTDTSHDPVATDAPTPDSILQLGHAFWGSKTLLSAVELGVFQALADGPLDGEALRQRLGLHPRSAADFFDALVALGMLERDDGATPTSSRWSAPTPWSWGSSRRPPCRASGVRGRGAQ